MRELRLKNPFLKEGDSLLPMGGKCLAANQLDSSTNSAVNGRDCASSELFKVACLTLLCTGCATYDSQESTSSVLESSIIQKNKVFANFEGKNLFAYIDPILTDVLEHTDDPGIQITYIPKNGSTPVSPPDSPETLAHIFLTFKDYPGNPPYKIYSRRLLQEDPTIFLPQPLQETFCNAIHSKNANIPFSVVLLPDDFLPGERVTWRMEGSDGTISKDAIFCPKPMILKDNAGKTIFEAALLSIDIPCFSYLLHFPARDEVVEFISTSGEEIMKNILPLNHTVNITYMPAVKGIRSGISEVEVRFLKDGSSYKMQLPWGMYWFDDSTPK